MESFLNGLKKAWKWIKKNWMWILVVPGAILIIYHIARFLVLIRSDSDDMGMPDLSEIERELFDRNERLLIELKEKIEKEKQKNKEKKEKITSGEKTPADVFNEELGVKEGEKE